MTDFDGDKWADSPLAEDGIDDAVARAAGSKMGVACSLPKVAAVLKAGTGEPELI